MLQRWLVVAGAVVALATLAGLMVPAEWRVLTAAVSALAVFAGVVLTWRKTVAEEALRARAASQEEVALRRARADRERSAILFGYNVSEAPRHHRRPGSTTGLGALPGDRRRPSVRRRAVQGGRRRGRRPCRVLPGGGPPRDPSEDDTRQGRQQPRADGRLHDRVRGRRRRRSGCGDVLDGRRTTSFVEDVAEWEAARAGRRGTRSYGTFITARVEAGGVAFGILTVNAVRPGSLLHEDKLYVAATARILGLAELLCLTTHAHRTATDAAAGRSGMSGVVPMIGYRQEGAS
ncbi:hypothetical protein [Clavibacter tessellarius]|uniref:hypothetical protein n=1 Tax=Clavibacter tessellarius TaxID=31965 RepID=UPI0032555C5C